MEIYQDCKELLELFNAQKVEYVIVGGHALAFHGAAGRLQDLADAERLEGPPTEDV